MPPEDTKSAELSALTQAALPGWNVALIRELGGGHSKARVFVVDLSLPDASGGAQGGLSPGQYVLKIGPPSVWEGEPPESDRHTEAVARDHQFASDHTSVLRRTAAVGERLIQLFEIAGGSLVSFQGLSSAPAGSLGSYCGRISADLLGKWNRRYTVVRPTEALSTMRTWLAYRLRPDLAPLLTQFVAEQTGARKTFGLADKLLVNPLWVATAEILNTPAASVAIHGYVHGDLHGENILVERTGSPTGRYFLIDFALAQEAPLGFDHAYLELDLLLSHLQDAEPRRMLGILEELQTSSRGVPIGDIGIVECLQSLRAPITAWQQQFELQRADSVGAQVWLARIAAGLNWTNKRIAGRRRLSLAYAAYAATKYLEIFSSTELRLLFDEPPVPYDSGSLAATPPQQITPDSEDRRHGSVAAAENSDGREYSFETSVGAAFLSMLLCGTSPPLLPHCRLEGIYFRSSHLGWNSDGPLLVGTSPAGDRRQAAVYVTAAFAFDESDASCIEAISNAWTDFGNAALFSPGQDVFGFVVSEDAQPFYRGVRALLDCVRLSADYDDLDERLRGSHTSDAGTALSYRDACRAMITRATGNEPQAEKFYGFLRSMDFIQMNFGPGIARTEAGARTILNLSSAMTLRSNESSHWPRVVGCASKWATRTEFVTAKDVAAEVGWQVVPAIAPFEGDIATLQHSTAIALQRINPHVGGVSVPRIAVEAKLAELVGGGGVVIVSGEPGAGKSVLASRLFQALGAGGLALAFRPGMLSEDDHLHRALLGHSQTGSRLVDLGALYSMNFVLVESGERLLETGDSERDAFRDLLQTVASNPRWSVIVTCRGYAVETFRRAFTDEHRYAVKVLVVPDFDDQELKIVGDRLPGVAALLSQPRLRTILRKPLHLRLAASLSARTPISPDLQEFRKVVWREIVCKETNQQGGMAARRGECFLGIVLRRARSLEAWVPSHDLDLEVVQELRRDVIVVDSAELAGFLAPADDLLEDWALQHWIERQFLTASREPLVLFESLGTSPAIRRAFRAWLSDWLRKEFGAASAWTLDVLRNEGCPKHWVDDALTGALLSTGGGPFVRQIAENEGFATTPTLLRLLHLTRVACRRLPDAAREPLLAGRGVLLPEGDAWPALLEWLAASTGEAIDADAVPHFLRFIEDWTWLVSAESPYPVGASVAGRVALRIAASARSLSYTEEQRIVKRALKVAVEVPLAVAKELGERLEAVLNGLGGPGESAFLELVLGVIDGSAVARDIPEITIACIEHVFGLKLPKAQEAEEVEPYEVEAAFGIPPIGRRLGFPASAFHGPYHSLFQQHPRSARDLVVRVANYCCGRYGQARGSLIEGPGLIEIGIPGGPPVKQWLDARLWGLYQGATVGPYALASALMALEHWLLARAEQNDASLEGDLLDLIRESNNVAVTAVVVSLAEAYPGKTWRVLDTLMRHREIFRLDQGRFIADRLRLGEMPGGLLGTSDELVYRNERVRSSKRPHRSTNLEEVLVRLQRGDRRSEILRIIDELRSQLPPEKLRTDDDQQWELILHRIDTRRFRVVGRLESGMVLAQAEPPREDLAAMMVRHLTPIEENAKRGRLFSWAKSRFEFDGGGERELGGWRDMLAEAMRSEGEVTSRFEARFNPWASAHQYVAAVCVRDVWAELTQAERSWCVLAVCRSVESGSDEDRSAGGERFNLLDGAMACATVVPLLALRVNDGRTRGALSQGVLHAKAGIVEATMVGVGRYLLPENRALALACVEAVVTYRQSAIEERTARSQNEMSRKRARARFRRRLEEDRDASLVAIGTLLTIDFRRRPWSVLTRPLISLFGQQPRDQLAVQFFQRLAVLLARSWIDESRAAGPRSSPAHDDAFRDWLKSEVADALARVSVLNPPSISVDMVRPLILAVGQADGDVAEFFESVISAQVEKGDADAFRLVWTALSEACLDKRPSGGALGRGKLIRMLFLNVSWRKEVKAWPPIGGWERDFLGLFERLEASGELVDAFVRFLSSVGSNLVPEAIPNLAGKLRAGANLSERSTRLLEPILGSVVYGGVPRLRTEKALREGTMILLDAMIDAGSSAAYRMRDDFLTPLSIRPA